VVTGESFNAVIGARRGSTEAQSRRDREEEHERALLRARQRVLHEGALKEWQDAIVAANGEWRPVMDGLAVTYDNPSLQTDANAEKLIVSLIDEAQWHPRGLACAIERGDPEGWPG
jgi:hypothetical protein